MSAWGYTKIKNSIIKDFLLKVIGIPHPYGRLRAKNALRYIRLNNGKTLDFGSGEGIWMMELSKRKADMYGIDISFDALKNTQNILLANNFDAKIVQGDAQKPPFRSNSFDQIICLDVLEHVEDPNKIFNEANRCLKKDG
ncbi:MAG: class I SAM-dependent methyltransferase, partial [Nanoarchaeota archaeon]